MEFKGFQKKNNNNNAIIYMDSTFKVKIKSVPIQQIKKRTTTIITYENKQYNFQTLRGRRMIVTFIFSFCFGRTRIL